MTELAFPPLIPARLIRRYKRFLADVELLAGERVGEQLTVHCPNTGAMTGCAETGWRVWLSESDNPKRKYPHTWELVENAAGDLCVVNTQRANWMVGEWLRAGLLPPFADYQAVKPEVKVGEVRFDFRLQQEGLPDCFIEVKSVTLLQEAGVGAFPDAVTERGRRHLEHLTQLVQQGSRAVMLYLVPHLGIKQVTVATEIDPKYAQALSAAQLAGVEVYAWQPKLALTGVSGAIALPFQLPG